MTNRARLVVLAAVGVLSLGILMQTRLIAENKDQKSDPAVERTRKQVRMLDDLYKSAIVLITDKYVNNDSDLPAGSAFQALFAAMKQKGWHEVRLIDATNEPLRPKNAPADDFEKEAVKRLLAGNAGHEQVVEKDGKRYLRSATAIPVVMKKCILCHPHYEEAKPGQAIGALAYTIPIE
ncbi:MAG TPA: DUF3365 domain-containing protein [Planctomycetaceae bacterium]|jgi:hypothetical protein|nr:DUF3365 domain-containing protein [Planctomycetaceae bacterium]